MIHTIHKSFISSMINPKYCFYDDKLFVFLNHNLILKIHLHDYFMIEMGIIFMDKTVIIVHIYVISFNNIMNWFETPLFFLVLSKLLPLSPYVWSITSAELWWYNISSLVYLSSNIQSLIQILDSVSVYFWK